MAERERVRGWRRWHRGVAERGVDRQCPFVELLALPDEQDQPSSGPQCRGDVGEGGDRIGEEHGAEAVDREVEALGVEATHLGVAELVAHVLEPLGRGELTGALEHSLRDIDPDDGSRGGRTPGLASRQLGPAADVENLIAVTDPGRPREGARGERGARRRRSPVRSARTSTSSQLAEVHGGCGGAAANAFSVEGA